MSIAYDDAKFRAQLPEFADAVAYPQAVLAAQFDMATIFIAADGSPCDALSGKPLVAALNYMTAHLLIASQRAQVGTPGNAQGGFETSSSIGEISVSVLAPPAKDAWDWWLYQTQYGQALMALLKMLAVGGLSVGGLSERSGFRKAGGVFF